MYLSCGHNFGAAVAFGSVGKWLAVVIGWGVFFLLCAHMPCVGVVVDLCFL